MAGKSKDFDWINIEVDYRAGIKTMAQISSEYGVSPASIVKRAKKDGWSRDLQTKIRETAQAKVEQEAARKKSGLPGVKLAERQVVEVNAEIQKDVLVAHRDNAASARRLFGRLLKNLEDTVENEDVIDHITKIVQAQEETDVDSMIQALRKIMSLPGQAAALKTLSDTLKTVIEIERKAYGMDDHKNVGSAVDDAVKALASRG